MSTTSLKSLAFLLMIVALLAGSNGILAAPPAPGPLDSPPTYGTEAAVTEIGPETSAADVTRLFWNEAVGGPPSLAGRTLRPTDLGVSPLAQPEPKQMALAFVQRYASQLRVAQLDAQWEPLRTQVDERADAHVFLRQKYNGLRVFAGEVAVHFKDGAINAANGEYLAAVRVSTKPNLSLDAAYKAAVHELGVLNPVLMANEAVVYNPALLGLGPSANHLAYLMIIAGANSPASQTAILDAHTGKMLLSYSNLQEGRNRDIRDLNGSTVLPGPQCYSESGPSGSVSADCLNAFNYAGDVYSYFSNTHGRDSFDAAGATMRSSVRYGTMGNAFWNGSQTVFGPGFATKDVVAHEWTHAVTQYTADLIYSYQSGALNESMSDIFGAMVDRDDWLMGEDLPIGAIRSMSDPTTYGDPGKVSDSQYYCGTTDNGGVHTNSGVPNHAAYLMSEGGTYNGRTISGIGRNATERIFYRALTTYLTSGSDFGDTYNALISSATDLYGAGSAVVSNVTLALQATEMNQTACGSGGSGTPDSYEPDNTAGQAGTIVVNGAAQRHNFHIAGDNDWVKFTAAAGTSYVVETSNLGSASDTYMYLYGTVGTTVITYDDDSGPGLGSRIAWTATSPGTYYVRIRHYSSSRYGNDTNYDLAITGTGGTTGGDTYEPDDSPAQASTVTVNGAAQTHNFHVAGDVDWVKFAATAGISYVVETSNLGTASDTIIYLYGTDGTTVITSDDDSGPGSGSRIEWTASSNGTYYILVRHYSNSRYGSNTNYDLRVTSAGTPSDSYEPDNAVSQARPIAVDGAAQTHNFHVAGDNDWVSFTASAGTSYVIETLNLGNRSDTYIYLYSTNGTTLLASDDDSGGGLASRINWTAPSSGIYFVRVRHYSGAAYGSNTNYDIRVTSSSVCTGGDSYEPDNSPAQASTITVNGSSQTHNFYCSGDNDWAKFSATVGMDYVIQTLNLGAGSDTILYLYDTDGSTLITSNDDGGGGRASRIAWTASADGTFYVRVRHYSSTASGSNTNYDLRVTATGTSGAADAYEDDDAAARASTIASTQANHNFHVAGDADWAKFAATAGTSYVIETLNLGNRSDTHMYLYDTDATTLLREDDNGGAGNASRIAWTAPSSGNYYLKVRHHLTETYGANTNYDLRATAVSADAIDAYEPDDTYGQARPITVNGSAQTHNFHVPGDVDWASFLAITGTAYTIQTLNLGPASDTVLYLYGTDGTTLISANDDGGGGRASRISWTPVVSGTYFAKVRHYNGGAYGPNTNYDLQVISSSSSGGDSYEPDNTPAQASIITTDSITQTHNFHYPGDNDWARFSTTAGTIYFVETLNLGSRSDTFMYLYDTDGSTLLAYDDDSGPGLASRIVWTAPTSNTYYLRVRHFNSGAYGSNTSYDIRVSTSTGSGGDSFEPDNIPAQASIITTDGVTQTHDFHVAGDVDWAKFNATAGNSYTIQTTDLGPESDTYLYLYDTNGTTILRRDDDSGGGSASRIAWTAPSSGYYYAKVRHHDRSAYGTNTSYNLRVTTTSGAADAYEPDDSAGSARDIATDGTAQANHNFHVAGDADWVRFSATAGSECALETLNLGSWSDTYMELYDTDGATRLAYDDDSGPGFASRILYVMPASGTYYAKVRHFRSTTYGANTNYDLKVTCGSGGGDAYEPDNLPGQASNITVNGSAQTHNFHVADDVDWARFVATAGIRYVIETSNLGRWSDTYMYIYDTDGARLIRYDDDSGPGLGSRIVWTAPAGGTYYVRVRHYNRRVYGPYTNYDLRVTTASSLAAPAARAELTTSSVQAGNQVEAIVYVQQTASSVKVEALAKQAYLRLVEVTPLAADGQALDQQVMADSARWQMIAGDDGRTSAWHSAKTDWDGLNAYPAIRVRWQMTQPVPGGKLSIPIRITTIDQSGGTTVDYDELVLVSAATDPKIDVIQPTAYSNDASAIMSVQGSNFVDTPKLYLHEGSDLIPLPEALYVGDTLVRATVPDGTKPGTYKVQLVNPDGSLFETADWVSVTQPSAPTPTPTTVPAPTPTVGPTTSNVKVYFPLVTNEYPGGW
ncbi:MAG: pre-peptidase C-terminal domain-containing protein [Chloroflexi bacterium]|nr:pre-peptidase C-terminal domain-containing protein [Chloroflexota bacterium]